MALQYVRIGSMENVHVYDDAVFSGAIEVDDVIKVNTPPVDDEDVLRLVDVGTLVGDVTGPAASTDNAAVRFDGATGKVIQDSAVTIDDNGTINIPTGQAYKVNGTQVVSDQEAAIATPLQAIVTAPIAGTDTLDLADIQTEFNDLNNNVKALATTIGSILTALRTHGLIDT